MCANLIPESPEGLEIAKNGWHRGCYQRYSKTWDRLKPAVESSHPTSPEPCLARASSYSPQKYAPKRLFENSPFLFPPEKCLFCGKKTIKKQGKKDHLSKTFLHWSHKSSDWENVEKMAKVMQNEGCSSLLCKVTDIDLFAAETHFHKYCYHKFHSKFQTFKGYYKSKSTGAKEKQEQMQSTCCSIQWNKSHDSETGDNWA